MNILYIKKFAFCVIILLFLTEALYSQEYNNLDNQLCRAIIQGNTDKIQAILNKGIDLDKPIVNDWTPLMLAVEHEKSEVVSLLLKNSADVNKGKEKSIGGFSGGRGQIYIMSPLYLAADKNNFEIVRILIEHNARVYHTAECLILSVLVPVIKNGNRDMLEFLLEKGLRKDYLYPDILYKCLYFRQNMLFKHFYHIKDTENLHFNAKTMLENAVSSNNPEIVYFLVKKDIHKVKSNALHIAVKKGYAAIAEYLIENGVDIDGIDEDTHVPLYYAILSNNSELITLLLKHKASIKVKNSDENDFLHWAVLNGNRTLILLLLEKGVVVNTRNTFSTLKRIVFKGDKKILQLMLNKGLQVHGLNPGREDSLLYLALKEDLKEIAAILLSAGAEADEASAQLSIQNGYIDFVKMLLNKKYAFTTEHLNKALRAGHHDISILLIESGVEINMSEADYADPPLANAVRKEFFDIVELLLQKGADVNQLIKYCYDGSITCYTALDFAKSESMRALLLKHGAIPAREHPDYEYIPYEPPLGNPDGNGSNG
jgi:ankyrin repeat protein